MSVFAVTNIRDFWPTVWACGHSKRRNHTLQTVFTSPARTEVLHSHLECSLPLLLHSS